MALAGHLELDLDRVGSIGDRREQCNTWSGSGRGFGRGLGSRVGLKGWAQGLGSRVGLRGWGQGLGSRVAGKGWGQGVGVKGLGLMVAAPSPASMRGLGTGFVLGQGLGLGLGLGLGIESRAAPSPASMCGFWPLSASCLCLVPASMTSSTPRSGSGLGRRSGLLLRARVRGRWPGLGSR